MIALAMATGLGLAGRLRSTVIVTIRTYIRHLTLAAWIGTAVVDLHSALLPIRGYVLFLDTRATRRIVARIIASPSAAHHLRAS